jgi:hypothetical protein
MQAACFLLVVATIGQQPVGNQRAPERPPMSEKSPQLSRRSDRWFKNVQEASEEAKQWAYNQSLRVLPLKYRDVDTWKDSPPEIQRLLRVSATCAAALARLARQQVMEAYQLSPSQFSAIESNAALRTQPPSEAPTRFDPRKISVPRAIETRLTYPESKPPRPIPSSEEVRLEVGKAQLQRAEAEQQVSTQDKVREMEEMKRRKAAAEKDVDKRFKAAKPKTKPADSTAGPH